MRTGPSADLAEAWAERRPRMSPGGARQPVVRGAGRPGYRGSGAVAGPVRAVLRDRPCASRGSTINAACLCGS